MATNQVTPFHVHMSNDTKATEPGTKPPDFVKVAGFFSPASQRGLYVALFYQISTWSLPIKAFKLAWPNHHPKPLACLCFAALSAIYYAYAAANIRRAAARASQAAASPRNPPPDISASPTATPPR